MENSIHGGMKNHNIKINKNNTETALKPVLADVSLK